MPEACYNPEFMTAIFKKIKRVAFGGHTHLPGIFFENRPFLQQNRIEGPYPVVKGKFFVNVGSVGQPRDGDPRAMYALLDAAQGRLAFHRVAYDHAGTAAAIRAAGLPEAFAQRLERGR
jgi:diadenosine tetraphosphatase ApaH/serine/threonine PP2A family protein phosphatase